MKTPTVERMPCPACRRMHAAGEHKRQDGAAYGRPGKILYAPDLVTCECGMVLRHVVPLFMTDPFGWRWEILPTAGEGGAR